MYVVTYRPEDKPMLFHSRQRAMAMGRRLAETVALGINADIGVHENARREVVWRVRRRVSRERVNTWPIVMWPCEPKDSAIDALGELVP